jgi:hypothetical protein
MTGRTDAGMTYFLMLTEEEKVEAIRKMARSGTGIYTIAAATSMAVEQIRSLLGQRGPCEGCGE